MTVQTICKVVVLGSSFTFGGFMSTTFTCTTPDEGWLLYSHHLGDYIEPLVDLAKDFSANQDRITKLRAELLGHLIATAWQMEKHGYSNVSEGMAEIIELVLKPNIIDEIEKIKIFERHRIMNPKVLPIEQALEQLRSEHGH
jgi:hypothetical protein